MRSRSSLSAWAVRATIGNVFQPRVALQLGGSLPAVHAWQEQVHEDQMRRCGTREGDRVGAGRGLDDVVAQRTAGTSSTTRERRRNPRREGW